MNGFFAMAELAIVSARRTRLKQIAEEKKSKGAKKALMLAEDPGAYLSVVQIGVTLNTIFAGAYSGATMSEALASYLNQFSLFAAYSQELAFALIVGIVGYATLIIGELVPKRVALAYAEPIAIKVAVFMDVLAKIMLPFIWVLRVSTDLVLKLIGLDQPTDTHVTEDEIKTLIAEGTEKGVFKPGEKDMLEGVMRLADWSVRTIMTPRIDMVWLGIEDKIEDNLSEICASGYTRFPVACGDMEEVLGIVHTKDLLTQSLTSRILDFQEILRQPLFVPDTTPVLRLLDMFRQSGQNLAIIMDEYGSVEGMVTSNDILEAITGALPETEEDSEENPVQREDGSWLIDGMTPIEEVETLIGMKSLREGGEFHTIAGFMIDKLGRIPTAGDFFHWGEARFEVVDMDGRRVDKVLVLPPALEQPDDQEVD